MQGSKVFVAGAGEDVVIVAFALFYFLAGDTEASLNFGFVVGAALPEAAFEFLHDGGHDKHGDDLPPEQRIFPARFPKGFCALHVDIQEQVGACGELVLNLTLEGAVAVGVDVGVFVKIACFDFFVEGLTVKKIVVDPVLFPFARRSRRGGDDPLDRRFLRQHAVADRGLAATRRAGNDEEDAAGLGFGHQ